MGGLHCTIPTSHWVVSLTAHLPLPCPASSHFLSQAISNTPLPSQTPSQCVSGKPSHSKVHPSRRVLWAVEYLSLLTLPSPDVNGVYGHGAAWDHLGGWWLQEQSRSDPKPSTPHMGWEEEKRIQMGVQEVDFFFKCFKNKGIAALIGVVQSQGAGVKCWFGVSPAFAGVDS